MKNDPTEFRKRFAAWRNGELVYDAGRIVEKADATTVQRQEPVQPIKRQYGKIVDPKLVERKLQQQPVIKQGNTYKVKPRPLTFAGRVAQAVGGDWIKADMTSAGVSLLPVIGQLNGALDFGYDLNNSAHNMLDVEANTNTAMSGIALLPFVRNGLKMLKGKTLVVKLRNLYDKVMTSSNSADDVNKALKTGRTADAVQDAHGLDWSTWSKGGEISKLHLKEYKDIIKKYQNTPLWLMMEDGSKFRGDPRSWVQLMSKDAKKAGLREHTFPSYENIVYSGVRSGKINPEYMETQWTSRSPLIARSYAPNDNAVLLLVFPKSKYISTFDANGNYWPAIKTPQGPVVKAGDIVRYSKTTNSPLEIRNLSDHGPYFPYKSKYKTAEFNYGNGTISDDIILHEGYPRKSILYNNGDFNLSDSNIYKMLTPGILFGAGYGMYNKYAE